MDKTLLIVGAGANQIGIYKKARELGIRTIAADGNPDAPGFPHADEAHGINILDANALTDLARDTNTDGIYPAAELAVEAVAVAAETLDLPGIAPEVANRVRNKTAMRRALDAAGIQNPKFFEVDSVERAIAVKADLEYPFIVKPSDANSSKGVQLVSTPEDLDAAVVSAINYSFTDTALLEEFMPGEEFCVDGLVYQGHYIPGGITGKEMSPLPYRFDKGIHMPPLQSSEQCEGLEKCAREALEAIGFENGTFHLEIIVTPDGPRIVEIAGRPGGGRIPTDLIPMAYGYDFMADSIRIALGEAPESKRSHERGVALYWIEAEPGEVSQIEGREYALALEGVREVVWHTQVGDTLKPIIDCVSRDAVGYVLTEGSTATEAIERAHQARSICKVVTT